MEFLKKLLIFLSIVAVAYGDDDGMSAKEIIDMLQDFGEGCDPKPERAHIKEVVLNVEDAQYNSKCFRHCLMVQFDLISEGETKMNKEKAVEGMSMMFSDSKDDMDGIIEDCNTKNAGITDKCENAHSHGMCIFNAIKEKGYDIPNIKDDE